MTSVNWDVFQKLPGAAQTNFEMLCRALIRRHYGAYGELAALAGQPGVEFHVKLHTACALGERGRWYGWQCRWYDLRGARSIGTTRKRKIEEAIATTEKVLPDLTDWVLWTKYPLTAGDQAWFHGIKTRMRLCLWTSADVEHHLSGEATIFRGTYFGELVLTPAVLASLHDRAIAPIRTRWQPEVHQTIDAERALRRMLGETDVWDDLLRTAEHLELDAVAVDRDLAGRADDLVSSVGKVSSCARVAAHALATVRAALERGDLDLLRQQPAKRLTTLDPELAHLPHRLRACRHRTALFVANALADVRLACGLLEQVDHQMGSRLVAVLADAGCGKTELAAQLTSSDGERPAGVLLHGRDLPAGGSLDDLYIAP